MPATTSVVIPVYNDPAGLRTTVDSLLDQTASDYEVIVADNGSTDETAAVAREYAGHERVRRVVEDEIQSSYAARNAGIEAATGDVVGFVDADMWVAADYVESITGLVGGDEDDGPSYVGCNVELVADGGTIAGFRRATGFPIERYVSESRFAPTCCLVVHRRVFDAVGRFDDRLQSNGDLEFGRRVDEAGFELAFAAGITLSHPARSTVSELVAQNLRIGRGREGIRRYHGDSLDVRHPLDPRGFLPVHPVGFHDSVAGGYDSPAELPLWYLLACALKWCRTAGSLRARASTLVSG